MQYEAIYWRAHLRKLGRAVRSGVAGEAVARALCPGFSSPQGRGEGWEGPVQRPARGGQRAAPTAPAGISRAVNRALWWGWPEAQVCTALATNRSYLFFRKHCCSSCPSRNPGMPAHWWDRLWLNFLTYELSWRPSFKTEEKPNSTSNAGKRRPIPCTGGVVTKPLPGRRWQKSCHGKLRPG